MRVLASEVDDQQCGGRMVHLVRRCEVKRALAGHHLANETLLGRSVLRHHVLLGKTAVADEVRQPLRDGEDSRQRLDVLSHRFVHEPAVAAQRRHQRVGLVCQRHFEMSLEWLVIDDRESPWPQRSYQAFRSSSVTASRVSCEMKCSKFCATFVRENGAADMIKKAVSTAAAVFLLELPAALLAETSVRRPQTAMMTKPASIPRSSVAALAERDEWRRTSPTDKT